MLSYHKRLFFSTRQKDSGTSFWPVPESGKGGALLLAQYGAVCECDRMSVKVDRPIVGQGSDRAVVGQGPGAAFLYGDDCVVVDGGFSVGIFCDVDCAGEAAAAGERQLERGDAVYDDIALKRLVVCGKFDLCAVAAGSAPAVARAVAGHIQEVCIGVVVSQGHTGKIDRAVRVGHVEHVAVVRGECSAVHREGGGTDLCVSGHGLIDHDIVYVFIGAGTLCIAHVSGYVAVVEGDGILSFDDKCF